MSLDKTDKSGGNKQGTRVVQRSNNNANTNGGVAYVNANNDSSNTNSNIGSRLANRKKKSARTSIYRNDGYVTGYVYLKMSIAC